MVHYTAASRALMNSGYSIPKLALGTWLSHGDHVFKATLHALRSNYRHIDTAYAYKNEHEIGRAIHQFLSEDKSVKRSDIFVTTKVWNTFHSAKNVQRNCEMSLNSLCFDYIDLYMMHWPMGYKEDTGDDVFVPKDDNGVPQYSTVSFLETYSAMEKLVDQGKVKSIGVCNFNLSQLRKLIDSCRIKPAVVQNEIHPFNPENELLEFCKTHKIIVEAYAPLGAPNRLSAKDTDPSLLDNEVINDIATTLQCSQAAVLISWCISRGVVCLVKSVTPKRIMENFEAQNIVLSDEMMTRINNLSKGTSFKYYVHRDGSGHPDYPFGCN
ncbi:hypothetical protein GJ496_001454 [Pomphorhynchus laevis]|nr:hypothetical protein GJ496_001454 [Pomphorhynchus laevis]